MFAGSAASQTIPRMYALIAMTVVMVSGCGSTPAVGVSPVGPIVLEPQSLSGITNVQTAGLSLVDYDDDGWLDLTIADIGAGVLLYRGSAEGFIPDSERIPRVANTTGARAVIWVDIDDDGDLDLFVTRRGEIPVTPKLFRSDDGRLMDRTADLGLAVLGAWEGAAFGDLDGDGDLDLLLAGNVIGGSIKPPGEGGTPDAILIQHDGKFSDETESYPCQGPGTAEGWGAGIADVNRDGRMDYFVGNDHRTWTLCLSAEDGGFENASERVAGGYDFMGFAYGDAGGDGCIDLYGTRVGPDTLLMPAGDEYTPNTYLDAVDPQSDPTSITSGYGAVFADLDNDADQDLVWGAAFEPLSEGVLPGGLAVLENVAGQNGRLYSDISWAQPLPFGAFMHVYGVAQGDVDRDGRVDVMVGAGSYHLFDMGSTPLEALAYTVEPMLMRNRSANSMSLIITLSQAAPNMRAIGATIAVSAAGKITARTVSAGTSYLSSVPYEQHFGLGNATAADWVQVTWPDGHTQTFTNVAAGRFEITRSDEACSPLGSCDSIPPVTCTPFTSDAVFPIERCIAMCSRLKECDAFETEFEGDNCVGSCVNGDYDRAEGFCFLEAECSAIADCYVDEILLPFEREARRFSEGGNAR